MALVEIIGSKRELPLDIHEYHVRVTAHVQRALAANAESACGLRRHERRDSFERHGTLVTPLLEQDGER